MVEICKVLVAPALWVALLLVASTATRGDVSGPQIDRCGSPAVLTTAGAVGATR